MLLPMQLQTEDLCQHFESLVVVQAMQLFLLFVVLLPRSCPGQPGHVSANEALTISEIDLEKSLVFGPGLKPHEPVLPTRYFYVQLVDTRGKNVSSLKRHDLLKVRIDCNGQVETKTQVLYRGKGAFTIRYKLVQSCLSGLRLGVTYGEKHVASSPYIVLQPAHPDVCSCPIELDSESWHSNVGCPAHHKQIDEDLRPFPSVNFSAVLHQALERYKEIPFDICHYIIKANKIYRTCYGEHVLFQGFPDALLLLLTRTMLLPDMEFIINLGDWPLVNKADEDPLLPIFSWCGSNTTADILLPTYDMVYTSLEGLGRINVDVMTVQANIEVPWEKKTPKVFWRGRDSHRDRLKLITIAKEYPELINASITSFFIFAGEENLYELYGPQGKFVPFFNFFDHRYQLSIDGTVAAYRFPFLLAGDAVVLKSDSPYIEHFYGDLEPWVHYIPVQAGLGDLVEKIRWVMDNDDEARVIGENGRKYVQENLMPLDIICYYVQVFNKWAPRLTEPLKVHADMEQVFHPLVPKHVECNCSPSSQNLISDKQHQTNEL